MKKIILSALLIAIAAFYSYKGQAVLPVSSESTPQIFFVDKKLHRLISLDFTETGDCEHMCKKMVDAIISGRDNNPEILRMIPADAGSISVKLKKQSAYVDLSSKLTENISKNPENEKLVVYQLVNSLTSIEGIDSVYFTIDGKVEKNFLGFLDMREIFTPNYDI